MRRAKQFNSGYACAVAGIINGHGAGVHTLEALEANGMTTAKKCRAMGIEEYDIELFQDHFKEIRLRQKREKDLQTKYRRNFTDKI